MIGCRGADGSRHEIPPQAELQRNGREGNPCWSNLLDSEVAQDLVYYSMCMDQFMDNVAPDRKSHAETHCLNTAQGSLV